MLKLIACVFMFIDHVGYGIIHNYLMAHSMDIAPDSYTKLHDAYEVCKGIGRLAFPIFCFFIVEGFLHTRNVTKYAARLAVFAILSELPFDLGLYGTMLKPDHQNILVTFFMALIMLIIIRYLERNVLGLSQTVLYLTLLCVVIVFADLAYILHTDYSWKCMLLVSVLYFARSNKALKLIMGAAATCWEKYAPASFLLLYFYDPDIRPKYKYAFYLFYPLHLLLIYLIAKIVI